MSIVRDYALTLANDTISTVSIYYKRANVTTWTSSAKYTSVGFANTGTAYQISSASGLYDEIDTGLRPFMFYVDFPRDISDYDDSTTQLSTDELRQLLENNKNNANFVYGYEATIAYASTASFYIQHKHDDNLARIYFVKTSAVSAFEYSNYIDTEDFTGCTATLYRFSLDDNNYYNKTANPRYLPLAPYIGVTLTALSDYEFSTKSDVHFSSAFANIYTENERIISDDNKTLKVFYKLNAFNNPSYDTIVTNEGINCFAQILTIYATAESTAVTEYTITSQLENCSGTIPETVTSKETLDITISANDSYYFSNAPYLVYFDSVGQQLKYSFTISEDTKTATCNVAISDLEISTTNLTITVKASATAETVYKDDYGSIYVYHVTVANLQDFAAKRFFTESSGDTVTSADLGDYVAKLHYVYCNIGQENADTLKLGNYDTSIAVNVPYKDIIEIDCGTVEIVGINNNAVDYEGSIKIFLPFIGFQTLEIDTTINHIIGVKYKYNIISGDIVAFVTVDGVTQYLYDGKGAKDIYFQTWAKDKNGSISFESAFLYGFTPYILHNYFTSENNAVSNADSVRKVVNTLTGYFKMNELTNFTNENMTKTEHDEIVTMLESGVYYE